MLWSLVFGCSGCSFQVCVLYLRCFILFNIYFIGMIWLGEGRSEDARARTSNNCYVLFILYRVCSVIDLVKWNADMSAVLNSCVVWERAHTQMLRLMIRAYISNVLRAFQHFVRHGWQVGWVCARAWDCETFRGSSSSRAGAGLLACCKSAFRHCCRS